MSIIHLDSLLQAQSVAVIGASIHEHSIGHLVVKNLMTSGYGGVILPVHPEYKSVLGILTYSDIASLPFPPETAVIATPSYTVPDVIKALAKAGTKLVIVISAGFGEGDDAEGKLLQKQILEETGKTKMRIIGPNCIGVTVPRIGFNASFMHIQPKDGHIAFLSQSGALATSVVDWASARDIGFSMIVSMGAMADVDFGDMIHFLAHDEKTKSILLYMESVTNAKKFLMAAAAAALVKPIIVLKGGRHPEGAKAIISHTGSLAGSDEVYQAAFDRTGILRVHEMDELFDDVETLARMKSPGQGRLAILTNGGGMGIIAVDCLMDDGGKLAELSPESLKKLSRILPPTWSHGNPIDILGDADADRYSKALAVLLDEENVDGVLILNCPVALVSGTDVAKKIAGMLQGKVTNKAILTCWMGEGAVHQARDIFAEADIPTYETPGKAVRAYTDAIRYQSHQSLLKSGLRLVHQKHKNFNEVDKFLKAKLKAKITLLSEVESKLIFQMYGIPIVPTFIAKDGDEAAKLYTKHIKTGKVVVKIMSPDLTHKAKVGGVLLNLSSAEEVKKSATSMLEKIKKSYPKARIEGVTLQPMIEWKDSEEIILGIKKDATFGPVLMFGQGGSLVEFEHDTALSLLPIDENLCDHMMAKTKVFQRMKKSSKKYDIDGVRQAMLNLANLALDFPFISEIDMNPLLVNKDGVMALDGRMVLELS